jgi:S1-C subfamily serine protease
MHRTARRKIVGLATILVVASLACQVSVDFGPTLPTSAPPTTIAPEQLPAVQDILQWQGLASQQDALVALYQTASQGVVSLIIDSPIGYRQGSGFVIDKAGHILTNSHVVDKARGVEVVFQDGSRALAEIVGQDLEADLAVLRVEVDQSILHPLPFADSDQLLVGQMVIAIGNPFGLEGSMSTGIVSNLARTLPSLSTAPQSSEDVFSSGDLIQTDAAINPGNSGGPLLNLNGEVIGVNRAIRTFYFNSENNSLSSGVGFAIASNVVVHIVPSLIEKGRYDYPYLGISSITELTLTIAQEAGLESTAGALVRKVIAGGPAEAAGLMIGDLIVSVNGVQLSSSGELASYLLMNTLPGETVRLVYLRANKPFEVDLILDVRPPIDCDC